jgi:DNA-directed RNA polymerase subunit RPC12/RpoP
MAKSWCAAECKEVFSSLGAFDKHQKVSEDGRDVFCLPPKSVGLEYRNDAWSFPVNEQLQKLNKGVVTSAPKVYTCNCGKQFKNNKTGRGRPPTRCTDCGGKGVLV